MVAQVVPVIWVGMSRWVVVVSPSWPLVLRPQHHRVLSVLVAQVCEPPALTVAQVVPVIWVGTSRWVVLLSPRRPLVLRPQHHRVLSVLVAQVCEPPAL